MHNHKKHYPNNYNVGPFAEGENEIQKVYVLEFDQAHTDGTHQYWGTDS